LSYDRAGAAANNAAAGALADLVQGGSNNTQSKATEF
jgi:hypothetical protein